MSKLAHRLIALLILVAGTVLPGQSVCCATTSYHIGNSLTFDSQPLGIEALAESRGLEHQVGFHIRSSSSLTQILNDPEGVSTPPNEYGTFTTALPNNQWDVVTLQPHGNLGESTMGTDVDAIKTFINLTRSNPANQETNFYIYQTWPSRGNYQSKWLAPVENSLSTPTTKSRDYFNYLIERVRAETDASVYMIPAGDVLYELDVRMRNREIPGFSNVDFLYRDNQHLTFGAGRFVAGATTFSTILGQYPTALEIPEDFYGGPSALSAIQQAAILEAIRDVLDNHQYSGLEMPAAPRTDFNSDNAVDETDLQFLNASLGIVNPYDVNQDGMVNGRDFLAWQRNFKPTFTGSELLAFNIADLNGDGMFNAEDIQHWQASYGINDGADVDGDGDTDGRDFLLWQRSNLGSHFDANGDFLVNGVELGRWQQSYGYSLFADANGDGVVDSADYDIWVAENGRTWTFPYALSAPPLASQSGNLQSLVVPEPGTALLALLTVLLPGLKRLRSVKIRQE